MGFYAILVILGIGFILFFGYFIFKQIQFYLVAVDLYKKMINREDLMIKLLLDIRDKTKRAKLDELRNTDGQGGAPKCRYESDEFDLTPAERMQMGLMPTTGDEAEVAEEVEEEDDRRIIHLANQYEKIKYGIIKDLKTNLKTNEEIRFLESWAHLTYQEIKKLGQRPEDLTEKALSVYRLFIQKIDKSLGI